MGIWNWGIFRGLSNCKVFDWAGNKNMDLRNCSSPPKYFQYFLYYNPPPSTYFHSDSFERERVHIVSFHSFIHSFIQPVDTDGRVPSNEIQYYCQTYSRPGRPVEFSTTSFIEHSMVICKCRRVTSTAIRYYFQTYSRPGRPVEFSTTSFIQHRVGICNCR